MQQAYTVTLRTAGWLTPALRVAVPLLALAVRWGAITVEDAKRAMERLALRAVRVVRP